MIARYVWITWRDDNPLVAFESQLSAVEFVRRFKENTPEIYRCVLSE